MSIAAGQGRGRSRAPRRQLERFVEEFSGLLKLFHVHGVRPSETACACPDADAAGCELGGAMIQTHQFRSGRRAAEKVNRAPLDGHIRVAPVTDPRIHETGIDKSCLKESLRDPPGKCWSGDRAGRRNREIAARPLHQRSHSEHASSLTSTKSFPCAAGSSWLAYGRRNGLASISSRKSGRFRKGSRDIGSIRQ